MQYIAALDFKHMDNGMFLSAFAQSLSRQQNVHPIIIHGDSEYTERIIQTGVMREEAIIRSIKDLNHRLIALFADEGVSAIGINGYQRNLVTRTGNKLQLDHEYFSRLPHPAVLVLSSLVFDMEQGRVAPVPLSHFAQFLQSELKNPELFIFSEAETDELYAKEEKPGILYWRELDTSFTEEYIPEEFHDFGQKVRLTTAREFHLVPDLKRTSEIR